MFTTLKRYYRLTKPGIIRGNLITAIGAFFFAANGHLYISAFMAMSFGLAGVIASACVVNNYIDRDIDKHMSRTKKRALVTGDISVLSALVFAGFLGISGLGLLLWFTTPITALVAAFGFVAYVVLYGYFKRTSVHGTLVGTISGATPPVIGYTAVVGRIDAAAILLFLILVLWQMPHFYAIGIFRLKDYRAAKLPILPVVKGVGITKKYILAYVLGFTVVTPLLVFFGYVGFTYLLSMVLISIYWLWWGLNPKTHDDIRWAKGMFGISLLVLLVFSALIGLNSWLP